MGKVPSDHKLGELAIAMEECQNLEEQALRKSKFWQLTIEGLLICKGICNCSLNPDLDRSSARVRALKGIARVMNDVALRLPGDGFPGCSEPLFDKSKFRPGRLKAMVLKRQLRTAQVKVQEIIEKLVELQGVPQHLTDYEGDLCDRGPGQGFPLCPFGNPDLVFPHCRMHMERMLQDERRD